MFPLTRPLLFFANCVRFFFSNFFFNFLLLLLFNGFLFRDFLLELCLSIHIYILPTICPSNQERNTFLEIKKEILNKNNSNNFFFFCKNRAKKKKKKKRRPLDPPKSQTCKGKHCIFLGLINSTVA